MKKRNIRIATDAHREPFDDFADALRSAESREGWRSSETLRNFLDSGFRAVRGRLLVGEAFEKNEAEYMRVVKLCRNPKETMGDLARMLGALGLALREAGLDVARQAHWHMIDIDHRAMCAAYLQASFTDTSAIVVRGNTLSGESWITTPTPAAVLFPKSFDVAPAILPPPPVLAGGQLSLF